MGRGRLWQAARRQIAKRPPLDLSFADDAEAQAYAGRTRRRVVRAEPCPHGKRFGGRIPRLRRGALVGAGSRSLASGAADPARCGTRARPLRRARRQDDAARRGRSSRHFAWIRRKVVSDDCAKISTARISTADLIEADALTWEPKRQFDAILLDAPCSATGTFRRHPEVLYRARPQIIAASAEFQAKLLERAAQWLKPGGALVYSVCSLEPQEGEEVVSAFLSVTTGLHDRPVKTKGAARFRVAICPRLGPHPARAPGGARRPRRLLHGAACPTA